MPHRPLRSNRATRQSRFEVVRGWTRPRVAAVGVCLVTLAAAGCWRREPVVADDPSRLTIRLSSPAFADGGTIPKPHTCDGSDRSPPLEWSGVPGSAVELALICDDPDAPMGTWSHWVFVHLPPGAISLNEGIPAEREVPASAMEMAGDKTAAGSAIQGKNDFGKLGYGGPCPPGGTHRYVFRLYALDRIIEPASSPPKRADVLEAMKGHILAEGRLIGTYARGG